MTDEDQLLFSDKNIFLSLVGRGLPVVGRHFHFYSQIELVNYSHNLISHCTFEFTLNGYKRDSYLIKITESCSNLVITDCKIIFHISNSDLPDASYVKISNK